MNILEKKLKINAFNTLLVILGKEHRKIQRKEGKKIISMRTEMNDMESKNKVKQMSNAHKKK